MRHESKNKTRPLFTLSLEMTRLVNKTRLLLVPSVNSDIYGIIILEWNLLIRLAVLSFVERLSFSEVIFYRMCIHEYFQLVLCWVVCPLLECPLSYNANIVHIT